MTILQTPFEVISLLKLLFTYFLLYSNTFINYIVYELYGQAVYMYPAQINLHVKHLLPHNSFQYMYMHYLQFTLTDARQPVLARTLETSL